MTKKTKIESWQLWSAPKGYYLQEFYSERMKDIPKKYWKELERLRGNRAKYYNLGLELECDCKINKITQRVLKGI